MYDNQGGHPFDPRWDREPGGRTQSASVHPLRDTGASSDRGMRSADARSISELGWPQLFSIKSHGGKAAFEVKPVRARNDWGWTLNIEGAVALPADAARANGYDKAFDWKNKIVLQLTRNELPVFTAVMLGHLNTCRFDGHGIGDAASTKSFSADHQPGKIFINLKEAGKPLVAVPIPLAEALDVGHVALVQYAANFPGLTPAAALSGLARMSSHMMASAANRSGGGR